MRVQVDLEVSQTLSGLYPPFRLSRGVRKIGAVLSPAGQLFRRVFPHPVASFVPYCVSQNTVNQEQSNKDPWAISTRGLTKVYRGRITAVSDMTLQVRKGVAFGLLGPNGAGKSTLVKMLLSVVRPTAGTGALFGRDIRHTEARQGIGYMPEKPNSPPYLTGRGVFLQVHGQPAWNGRG